MGEPDKAGQLRAGLGVEIPSRPARSLAIDGRQHRRAWLPSRRQGDSSKYDLSDRIYGNIMCTRGNTLDAGNALELERPLG